MSETLAPPAYTPAASFDTKTAIPPAAYRLVSDGCKNIRVFAVPSDSEKLEALKAPLPSTPDPTIAKDPMEYDSDDSAKSPTETMIEQSTSSDGQTPDYYIFRTGVGDCILYEGAGPQKKKSSSSVNVSEPRKLMEFKGESGYFVRFSSSVSVPNYWRQVFSERRRPSPKSVELAGKLACTRPRTPPPKNETHGTACKQIPL